MEMAELRKISLKPTWGIEELLRLSGPVGQFVRDIRGETVRSVVIEMVSERLSEVDNATWEVEKRVGMWARVTFFSGVGCSVAYLCERLGSVPGLPLARLLLPFTIGATSALVCGWIGRVAGGAASERRRAWDTLSAALLRPLLPEQFSEKPDRNRARSLKSRCHDGA
jgi:hypothetical protein